MQCPRNISIYVLMLRSFGIVAAVDAARKQPVCFQRAVPPPQTSCWLIIERCVQTVFAWTEPRVGRLCTE